MTRCSSTSGQGKRRTRYSSGCVSWVWTPPAPISVVQVDAALLGRPIASRGPGPFPSRERAPVWELVEAAIRAGEEYAPSFYVLLTVAGLIAAVGILTNSQILVVGAMVVGPEYSAIIAVALASGHRDRQVRPSPDCWRCSGGSSVAVLATGAFALAVRATDLTPAAYRLGLRPVSALIGTPNVFSVVVATLAGIVGVVSLTEARANALIGVFISVTTIPAAADIGVSLAYRNWHEAAGSALQLLLNVGLLLVVGAGGLAAQRRIWTRFCRWGGSGIIPLDDARARAPTSVAVWPPRRNPPSSTPPHWCRDRARDVPRRQHDLHQPR